jgi:hypothetical protein
MAVEPAILLPFWARRVIRHQFALMLGVAFSKILTTLADFCHFQLHLSSIAVRKSLSLLVG